MSTATISKRPRLQASGHSDDFQTPASALDPLLPYLPPGLIWEPSCGKGNLVRGLKRAGRTVIGTDILHGHDALTYAPPVFDCADFEGIKTGDAVISVHFNIAKS